MYKIKVLIVEDDFLIAADIKETLTKHNLEITNICLSGEEALARTPIDKPDLILMDIKLEGDLDGIEAGKSIREQYGTPIIFLTDYTDSATVERAKKVLPVNYLGKPFNENDLVRAIDLAFHNANESKKYSPTGSGQPYVFLKEGFKYVKVEYKDIIILKADRAYCTLITDEGQFTFSKSLNKIAEELTYPRLFRTHRSYIVNTDKITQIMGNIITLGKHQAELSKERREDFLQSLKKIE